MTHKNHSLGQGMGMLHNGSASVFQTDGESSILSIPSNGIIKHDSNISW